MLAMYRAKGFTFVSLPEAQTDPAYKDDPDIAEKDGGAELELIMEKKRLKFSEEYEAVCGASGYLPVMGLMPNGKEDEDFAGSQVERRN